MLQQIDERREILKKNVVFVPLNASRIRDALQSFLFPFYGFYRSLLFAALCTYRLNYFNVTIGKQIVNIQSRLRGVQGLGGDNLGPPVSLL